MLLAVSSGFLNGARRARTADLLGAIQNPGVPAWAPIILDWPDLQGFRLWQSDSFPLFPRPSVQVRVAYGLQASSSVLRTDNVEGARLRSIELRN